MASGNDVNKRLQDLAEAVEELKVNRDALRAQLECPVCHDTCLPPIFMCKNGHNLCNTCREKVQDCPTCREPGRPAIKNMFAKSFSKQFTVDCKNKQHGCQRVLLKDKVDEHMLDCPNRFKCWQCEGGCGYHGHLSGLIQHIKDKHSVQYSEGIEHTSVPKSSLIHNFNLNFTGTSNLESDTRFVSCHAVLFKCDIHSDKDGLQLSTMLIGPRRLADVFHCWFEFSSQDGAFKFNYRVLCSPTDSKWFRKEDFVIVSPDEVKKLKRRDGSIMCQIRIERQRRVGIFGRLSEMLRKK